jgi:hypothetical protein
MEVRSAEILKDEEGNEILKVIIMSDPVRVEQRTTEDTKNLLPSHSSKFITLDLGE